MNFWSRFSIAAETLLALCIATILVVACGGGGGAASGFLQTYSSSAGAGEVLQFSVDTANLSYTYTDIGTSYAASGVSAGQTGSGSLTSLGNGLYAVGPSSDGFITSGKVFPIQNGFLVGDVVISRYFGTYRIPVFGLSSPITSIAQLAGYYNYQGFACSSRSFGDVQGNYGCLSHFGTISISATSSVSTDDFTRCKSGNAIVVSSGTACSLTRSGTLSATLTRVPGVFDLYDKVTPSEHIGWLFAVTAPNGQVVGVIDHDDPYSGEFGHTVLTTYASAVPGVGDGNYFVKNNIGGEHLVTLSGTTITSTEFPMITGAVTFNQPWDGFAQYQFPVSWTAAASGVAMIAGTGAFTHTDNAHPALFAVGLKY